MRQLARRSGVMPWKENEDGSLARGEDKNPIWVNEAGLETPADYVGLTKRLSEVNAESKGRKDKLRELEARLAPLAEAGVEDIPAFLAEARDAIEMKKNAPDRDKAVEEQVKLRLEAVSDPLKKQIAARDKLLDEERRRLAEVTERYHATLVKSDVLNSRLLKERVMPDVRPFLEREMARAGTVENGKVGYRDANGEIIYGDKGDPAGSDEAALAIVKGLGLDPAKMLTPVHNSSGSEATAGAMLNGALIKNPWARDSWNVTAQMELYNNNPAEANRLMQAAGRRIPAGR